MEQAHEEIVGRFAAQNAMRLLRANQALGPDLMRAFTALPWADYLRKEVSVADTDCLLALLLSPDSWSSRLGLVLVQRITEQAAIRDALVKLWFQDGIRDERAVSLICALVEYPDLYALHAPEFLAFIEDHRSLYVEAQGHWFGDSQSRVLERTIQRLQSDARSHRRWWWLYRLSLCRDLLRPKAAEILSRHAESSDLVCGTAARAALMHLKQEGNRCNA